MSKPVAEIVGHHASHNPGNESVLRASNYFRSIKTWVPFIAYSRFLGLFRLTIIRIMTQTQVEIEMMYYPRWPKTWLGRLAHLIFGRRVN